MKPADTNVRDANATMRMPITRPPISTEYRMKIDALRRSEAYTNRNHIDHKLVTAQVMHACEQGYNDVTQATYEEMKTIDEQDKEVMKVNHSGSLILSKQERLPFNEKSRLFIDGLRQSKAYLDRNHADHDNIVKMVNRAFEDGYTDKSLTPPPPMIDPRSNPGR